MIEGYVEVIHPLQVRGWAYDTESVGAPVTVVLVLFDDEIAATQAKMFRPDLLKSGKGDGRCGFVFQLGEQLKSNVLHCVQVRIAPKDGTIF